MKNKKVIISAIALLVIVGILIAKTTYLSSKSDVDETYNLIVDEDTEYEGEEITSEYLPNEVLDYGEEVEYFYKDYQDPMKNMPYVTGSEKNYIPLD